MGAKQMKFCGAGMHRSEAEGRFGAAEPEGRSSVCARALTFGVSFCQEENIHFTFKNASLPLFIGVRCIFASEMDVFLLTRRNSER